MHSVAHEHAKFKPFGRSKDWDSGAAIGAAHVAQGEVRVSFERIQATFRIQPPAPRRPPNYPPASGRGITIGFVLLNGSNWRPHQEENLRFIIDGHNTL